MSHYEPPIHWNDHEDIALKLYERFGDDFNDKFCNVKDNEVVVYLVVDKPVVGVAIDKTDNDNDCISKIILEFNKITTSIVNSKPILLTKA